MWHKFTMFMFQLTKSDISHGGNNTRNKSSNIWTEIFVFSIMLILLQSVIQSETAQKGNQPLMKHHSGYIDVTEGKLYFEDQGTGDVVILVHDGLFHSVSWDSQFEAFSRVFRVIRYDRRGYGQSTPVQSQFSDIEDLNQVYESLNITSATLIGCSAGSELSLDFTIEHPDKVRNLILIGPVVRGLDMTRHFYTRGGRLKILNYYNTETVVKYFCFEDPYETASIDPKIHQKMYEWITKYPNNFDLNRGQLKKLPETPTLLRLSEIRCPVLILTGEFDIPDVHAHSGAIAAGIKYANREVISGAAHLAHMDQPEEVNRLILEFCALNQFQNDIKEKGLRNAIDRVRRNHRDGLDALVISENSLNTIGYRYLLEHKEVDNAIAVFELNTMLYPDSFNVYDSLGEAYMARGDYQEAIKNYKKSLDINPDNESAKAALEKITAH